MTNATRPSGGFTQTEWDHARPWSAYLEGVTEKADIWRAHASRVAVDEDARDRLASLPGVRRILVLSEDWCGDAARSVPVLAAAFDAAPTVEHRYLDSDDHPGVLDRYRTHGGRAIPIAVVQDEQGLELGAWGPRPAPLQAILRARLRELGPPAEDQRAAWYAPLMGWYAKDAGRTTIREILMLLERGGTPR